MKTEIKDILQEIGLTETEATIYLYLVKKGTATAYKIAKDTKLYRANTYKAVENLINKSIVTQFNEDNKKILRAIPPDELISILDRQKEKLQAIIPLIERTFLEETQGVTILKGSKAFMNFLYTLLEKKDTIYAFDIPSYVPEIIKYHIMKFHKERIKNKIKMYHIYDYDATERINFLKKMKYTYAVKNKQKRHSLTSTIVCKDTTLIVNWKKDVKTVIIRDEDVAKTNIDQYSILANL